MNAISNGKMVKGCLTVSILFKTDILLPIMPNWLSRTISVYFSGSRPLRHNEVQLRLCLTNCGYFVCSGAYSIAK